MNKDRAATTIEKYWKGYKARNQFKFLVKKDKKRRFIAKELLETERVYVKSLDLLKIVFYTPILAVVNSGQISVTKSEFDSMFMNFLQISNVHVIILSELEIILANWDKNKKLQTVGALFFRMAHFLKLYILYCQGYDSSIKMLNHCMDRDKKFRNLLQGIADTPSIGETLESFLIRPVQRIPRYKLMIEDLAKNTTSWHPDNEKLQKAKDLMEETAMFINQSVHRKAHMEKVLSIQNKLTNFNKRVLVRPTRFFVHEGDVTKINRSSTDTRHLVVFNDAVLLLTTRDRYKNTISLWFAEVRSVESADPKKWLFILLGRARTFLFCVEDEAVRNTWVDIIDTQIKTLENSQYKPAGMKQDDRALCRFSAALSETHALHPPPNPVLWKKLLASYNVDWDQILSVDENNDDSSSSSSSSPIRECHDVDEEFVYADDTVRLSYDVPQVAVGIVTNTDVNNANIANASAATSPTSSTTSSSSPLPLFSSTTATTTTVLTTPTVPSRQTAAAIATGTTSTSSTGTTSTSSTDTIHISFSTSPSSSTYSSDTATPPPPSRCSLPHSTSPFSPLTNSPFNSTSTSSSFTSLPNSDNSISLPLPTFTNTSSFKNSLSVSPSHFPPPARPRLTEQQGLSRQGFLPPPLPPLAAYTGGVKRFPPPPPFKSIQQMQQ